jgi:hypothetical protein
MFWKTKEYTQQQSTATVFFGKETFLSCTQLLNPLPLLFKALLQGQKDYFFQRAFNLHTTTRALYSV